MLMFFIVSCYLHVHCLDAKLAWFKVLTVDCISARPWICYLSGLGGATH